MKSLFRLTILSVIAIFLLNGCQVPVTTASTLQPTSDIPFSTDIPYGLISSERMLDHLEVLTNIQAYSGFRSAGTAGEAEALDYIAGQLDRMQKLKAMGSEVERQTFDVFISTEIHSTRLLLTGINGIEVDVPASAIRGSRYQPELTRYFDSDGLSGDLKNDPMIAGMTVVSTGVTAVSNGEAEQPLRPIVKRTMIQLAGLSADELAGKVLIVDAHLFDGLTTSAYEISRKNLLAAIDKGVAGVIMVSEYSNRDGYSHGSFLNEGYFLQNMVPETRAPIVSVRMEDLAPAGITGWKDMDNIAGVRLSVDSDVRSPAPSGNLALRIPGKDSSQAVILSAHIDSPNTPGGFDDGSGTVILLEIAEVLNESQLQPDVDLWLVWHGSHENGLFGSAHFAATHAELLDHTLAMLNIDCLGLPLEENDSAIFLDFNSYARFGDDAATWQEYLAGKAAELGIEVELYDQHGLIADNSNYDTYNVPEVDMIYFDPLEMEEHGNSYMHYANHWHDPYETVDVVRQVSDVLVDMTRVALAGAIQTGRDTPNLRVTIPIGKRALFVASHTQPVSTLTSLRELGMALAYAGFDVDPVPYGEPVIAGELVGVGIVIVLPTIDYPGKLDETWSQTELNALKAYVEAGGFLVVTNSEYTHIMTYLGYDPNEDKLDLNALLSQMGVMFNNSTYELDKAYGDVSNPLTDKAEMLLTYADAGVSFTLDKGEVLYTSGGKPIIAMVDYGDRGGQVLVIGDLGILIDENGGAGNLQFLQNIAAYAMER